MTDPANEQIHETTDEARAGTTPHIVRYVLGISLLLAILALSAIWITGALNASDDSGQQAAQSSYNAT